MFRPFLIDFHDAGLWLFCLAVIVLLGVMSAVWWAADVRAALGWPGAPGPVRRSSPLPVREPAAPATVWRQGGLMCQWVSRWVEGA